MALTFQMIKSKVKNPICTILVLVLFTSCNGQTKPWQPNTVVAGNLSFTSKKPKLTKTQGTDQYQNVHCGLQDKDGNLWFGTAGEGLYRYDGKWFTQFTVADGLSCNFISSLLEDKNGNIWIGTRDGLCRYDGNKITPFTISKGFMTVANNNKDYYYSEQSKKETVWDIYQDKSGKIWFGTGDGLYCYDGNIFTRFLDNPDVINKSGLKLKMVSSILEDKMGNIWFASGMPPGQEGICRYDGSNLVSFKPQNEVWFRKIIEDKNKNLIFVTRIHGALFCDPAANNFGETSFSSFPQPKELLNNSLTTILKDNAGNIWMASDYGKDIGDTLGGVWCYRQSAMANEKLFTKITNHEVSFMLEDKEHNIWLGTRGMGLYRYDGTTLTSFSE
ncbi:hypothetical protein F0919_02665 [Taibaiella lutea]|uniref:Two component regulator propeller n=1 Tax=Taibaiella lutea TaxID=2608001 RepID=A0A5M6CQC8_9BACT|nr:two-component regulator propeller domain-containing protein [Taibaiella lutea]KAA5536590.1 hypothetical protein F0919_02665 [Taibaiella lutea]